MIQDAEIILSLENRKDVAFVKNKELLVQEKTIQRRRSTSSKMVSTDPRYCMEMINITHVLIE